MKTRFLLFAIAVMFVISAGSVWAARTPSVATTDPACAFPDMLATEGLYERAGEEYDILLEATPGLPCAQTGVANSSVALTPTPTPHSTPFAEVRALNRAGQTDEAKALLVEEIKDHPEAEIPRDLSNLVGNPLDDWHDGSVGFVRWADNIIGKLAPFLLTLLTAIAAVVALWLVAQQLGRRILSNMDDSSRVDVAIFNTELSGSSAGRSLTESVQAAFQNTRTGRPGPNAKLVEEAEPAATSGATVELLKVAGNPFSVLYEWLKTAPPTVYVLEGTTLVDKEKGAGINLTLKRGNEIERTVSIWQRDFQDANTQPVEPEPVLSAYLDLVEAASIWLYDATSRSMPDPVQGSQADGFHVNWRHWKSYALFRAAIESNSRGERKAAIVLLHRSLALDPYFLPARMNLYTIEMQLLEDGATDHEKFYNRYANLYQELYDNWHGGKATTQNPAPALTDAEEVVAAKLIFNYLAAADYRAGWEHPSQNPPDPDVRRRLESAIKMARNSAVDSELREMVTPLELMRDTLNIRFGELATQTQTDARPGATNTATNTAGDTRAEYLEMLNAGAGDLNAFGVRNLYGLAVLCVAAAFTTPDSNQDTWIDHAFTYLGKSIKLEPDRVRERAVSDWSLEPLRTHQPSKDRFQDLVSPPAQPSRLGKL